MKAVFSPRACRSRAAAHVIVAALLVYSSHAMGDAKSDAAEKEATRSIMQTIFTPIAKTLPLSFNDEKFSAPENQPKIKAWLKTLADQAHAFESHAHSKDRGFEYVAKSLARDARDLHRWYEKGWYNEARFTLHNITENCISCHSKLPGKRNYPGVGEFFKTIRLDELPPLERAHLQVVARQFDDATKTYETLFRSKDLHPSIIVLMDAFSDYLKLSIRVHGDVTRPLPIMQMIHDRKDTPRHVKERLAKWIVTLKDIDKRKLMKSAQLSTAKQLISEARKEMDFPKDRDGLIHYIAASGLLQQYIGSRSRQGEDVAEAFYLLGISESLLGHSFWISQMEFNLETAIRLAPGAPFATKAYSLLEEHLVTGFTGSSGTHVPDDVQNLLSELKKLIENPNGAKI